MNDEVAALKENNTYTATNLPKGKTTIGSKWVYSVMVGSNNEQRYKARLVARGFSQIEGLDYYETFSPAAKITSIKTLLQLAVQKDFIIQQMDVKCAYLNADLDEQSYLDVPDGFQVRPTDGHRVAWEFNKSLYGLKQSGRNWNSVFHTFLITHDFKQSLADPCVYSKCQNDSLIIIIIFVDDFLIGCDDMNLINGVKGSLCDKSTMKDLGNLSYFWGIGFKVNDGCIEMSQARFIERILDRFNVSECNPKSIPCDPSIVNLSVEDSTTLNDSRLYKEIVGSLIYLMACTRPDIVYVVAKLSWHMCNPTIAYLNSAKNVLWCLKGTKH